MTVNSSTPDKILIDKLNYTKIKDYNFLKSQEIEEYIYSLAPGSENIKNIQFS